MNERIKELAEQADLVLDDLPDNILMPLENFAELIIQECIGVLSLTKDGTMKMNLNGHMLKLVEGIGKAYSTGIKEHFYGVEECNK
jgi:hypothetical protein